MTAAKKKEDFDTFEIENVEVRFYDVRSSKGRLPFLSKVSAFPSDFLDNDASCLVSTRRT